MTLSPEQKGAIYGTDTGRIIQVGGIDIPLQALLDLAREALKKRAKDNLFKLRHDDISRSS